ALDGSPRIARCKTALPSGARGDRSSDPYTCMDGSPRVASRHALLHRSKCADRSIDHRASRNDRAFRAPCPTDSSPDRSPQRLSLLRRRRAAWGFAAAPHQPRVKHEKRSTMKTTPTNTRIQQTAADQHLIDGFTHAASSIASLVIASATVTTKDIVATL